MRNVRSYLKLGALGLAAFLVSCKSPDLEISSINKKLPAPQLKSGTQSPFDQDLETQTYVRVQGTCDSRVGDIYVSFNNQLWAKPPSLPTYAGTTLAGTEVNDVNCADGKFDFYLTSADILAVWGVQTGSANTSGSDVDAIYIKGETLIGETFTLVLKNSKSDHNDGGPATTVSVEKMSPAGFATAGQCELFYLYVKNANGYNTSHSSDIDVTLKKSISGGTYSNAEVYSSMSDCDSNTNALGTLTIPATKGMLAFYYKAPSDSGSLNQTSSLKINSTSSSLTASPTAATYTVREYGASNYRYISIQSPNWRLYKSVCTAFTVTSNKYGYGQYGDDYARVINLETNSPSALIYSDSSCSTRATSATITAYSSQATFYVKYTKAASETTDFPSFKFIASSTSNSGSAVTWDYSPIFWNVDTTSKSTNTMVSWNQYDTMPNILSTDYCYPAGFTLVNENFTPIPSSIPVTISLRDNSTNANAVTYYYDPACTSSITETTIYKSGSSTEPLSANFYYKIKPTAVGNTIKLKAFDANNTIVGLSNLLTFVKVANTLAILGPSTLTAAGQCEPIGVMLTDTMLSTNYSPLANVVVNITSADGTSQNALYSDANCTVNSSMVTLTGGGGGQATLYMKVNSLPTNQTITFYPTYTPGPYPSLGWISLTLTVQP